MFRLTQLGLGCLLHCNGGYEIKAHLLQGVYRGDIFSSPNSDKQEEIIGQPSTAPQLPPYVKGKLEFGLNYPAAIELNGTHSTSSYLS